MGGAGYTCGPSADGGFDELDEFWFSLASSSATRAVRVKALYNGLSWLATNKDQLGEVFTKIAESLPALNTAYVPGSTDPNAFQNKVLAAMKSAAPLFLSFLASQFGLGKLPTTLRKAIGYVPKKIENALRKGLQSFAKKAGGGTAVKEKNASLTSNKNNADVFEYGGKVYRLVVAAESKGGTTIKIVDKETSKPVGKPLKEEHFTTAEAKQEFRELAVKADDLRNKAKKPLAGQPRANVAALKPLQADVNKERGDLLNEHYIGKCVFLNAGCFAAGTKLWTPQGYRAIEDIRPGERVYSRDQWDEHGEIVAKIVEEVFTRYTTVLEVVADGRTIRTTGEHPFFIRGKGWTPANELRVGDRLLCADTGKTVTVEAIRDTGERELVYNLRVSEYHTYFVGGDEWGFSVWAHNAYTQQYYIAEDSADFSKFTVYDSLNGTKLQAKSASPDGAVSSDAFISQSTLKDAFAFVLKHKQEFDIRSRDQIYNVEQGTKTQTPDPINGRKSSRINNLWTKVIASSDALGRNNSLADTEYTNFKGVAPASFTDPYWQPPGESQQWSLKELTGTRVGWPTLHAHHIVAKNRGSTAAQSDWWNSQLALRTVGIDPYFGVANLAWTPNWVKHGSSGQYRQSVWKDIHDALPNLVIDDNPTPQTVAAHKVAGDDVAMKNVLLAIANNFFVGKYVM